MRLLLIAFILPLSLRAADYRAGTARVKISPEGPIYLNGYAARTHPSEGVADDLWAKAVAIEDGKGQRFVLVTTDLLGIPGDLSQAVSTRVEQQLHVPRARLMLNSSHTHAGPVVGANLRGMFLLKPEDDRAIDQYTRRLEDALVSVVKQALDGLTPVNISYGSGHAEFAINRRAYKSHGVKNGLDRADPVDYSVPVLRFTTPEGKVKAVVFGYACHNTTLGGDFYKASGDYAGFAQRAIEARIPGATALFVLLCAADQNPDPRSTMENARQHGEALAGAVAAAMDGKRKRIRGPIQTAWVEADLPFAPYTRATFENLRSDKIPAKAHLAAKMLKQFDAGNPVRSISYPVQAVRFGKSLTMLALGGEVTVGYALRLKREFPNEPLIVAGYSNNVMCYIPTDKVLQEGGYEAVDSMTYYGQPGPFAPGVEEKVIAAAHQALAGVKRR